MNNPIREVRESLGRLSQLGETRLGDLAASSDELAVLLLALRAEVEAQTSVVNTADSSDPAYNHAASDLVELLQLTQAAVDAKAELGRLAAAAGKALNRVLKKAPK